MIMRLPQQSVALLMASSLVNARIGLHQVTTTDTHLSIYYPLVERRAGQQTMKLTLQQLKSLQLLSFSEDSAPKPVSSFSLDLFETDGNLPAIPSLVNVQEGINAYLLQELNAVYDINHQVKTVNAAILAQSASASSRRLLRDLSAVTGSQLETQVNVTFAYDPSPSILDLEDKIQAILAKDLTPLLHNISSRAGNDRNLAKLKAVYYIGDMLRSSPTLAPTLVAAVAGGGNQNRGVRNGTTAGSAITSANPDNSGNNSNSKLIKILVPVLVACGIITALVALLATRRRQSQQHQSRARSILHSSGDSEAKVNLFYDTDDIFSIEAALVDTTTLTPVPQQKHPRNVYTMKLHDDQSDIFSGVSPTGDNHYATSSASRGYDSSTRGGDSRSVFSFLSGFASKASTVMVSNVTPSANNRSMPATTPMVTAMDGDGAPTGTPHSKVSSLFTFSEEDSTDLVSSGDERGNKASTNQEINTAPSDEEENEDDDSDNYYPKSDDEAAVTLAAVAAGSALSSKVDEEAAKKKLEDKRNHWKNLLDKYDIESSIINTDTTGLDVTNLAAATEGTNNNVSHIFNESDTSDTSKKVIGSPDTTLNDSMFATEAIKTTNNTNNLDDNGSWCTDTCTSPRSLRADDNEEGVRSTPTSPTPSKAASSTVSFFGGPSSPKAKLSTEEIAQELMAAEEANLKLKNKSTFFGFWGSQPVESPAAASYNPKRDSSSPRSFTSNKTDPGTYDFHETKPTLLTFQWDDPKQADMNRKKAAAFARSLSATTDSSMLFEEERRRRLGEMTARGSLTSPVTGRGAEISSSIEKASASARTFNWLQGAAGSSITSDEERRLQLGAATPKGILPLSESSIIPEVERRNQLGAKSPRGSLSSPSAARDHGILSSYEKTQLPLSDSSIIPEEERRNQLGAKSPRGSLSTPAAARDHGILSSYEKTQLGNQLSPETSIQSNSSDSPTGLARIRRHAKSTTADGTTNYQHETMDEWSMEGEHTDDPSLLVDSNNGKNRKPRMKINLGQLAFGLNKKKPPKASGVTPKSTSSYAMTPKSAMTNNSSISGLSGTSPAMTAEASPSKQLISDLLWLEQKISATNQAAVASPNLVNVPQQEDPKNRDISLSDSLSFASGDGVNTTDANGEFASSPDKSNSDAKDSSLASKEDSILITHAIVCRDCYAPPGKLKIVIHSTKDGPAVHTVKKGSSLEGHIFPGDLIISVDNVDTRSYSAEQVMKMMTAKTRFERKITVLHFENESGGESSS